MRHAIPWLIALALPAIAMAQAPGKRPPPPPPDALAAPGGAGFAVDEDTGCWLWSRVVPPGARVRWSGPCPGGPATGNGELVWQVPRDGQTLVIRYIGSLVAGRMHGTGTYYFANGSRYEGEFRDHTQQGRGRYFWNDGRHYHGGIVNGAPSGEGTGTEPGGERYEGSWLNGRPNGPGVYRDAGGVTTPGVWREGCAVVGGAALGFFRPAAQCEALLRVPAQRPV